MKKRLVVIVLPLMILLLTMPVVASEQTWQAQWEITSWETNETIIRLDTIFTGEQDVWQGASFEYTATMTITFWDESLREDEYISLESIKCEYEGDSDLDFTKVTHDIDSKILNEKGDSVAATITFSFPEDIENQDITLDVIWVFDWHYTWIGPYTGYIYEETIRDSATMTITSINVATYNEPTGGGFCLGTVFIAIIPIMSVLGLIATKKHPLI